MHLVHPMMNHLGSSKGKRKFRNADAAKTARENAAAWNDLKIRYTPDKNKIKAISTGVYVPPKTYHRGMDEPRIPSLNNGVDSDIAVKHEPNQYTGEKLLGVSILHKSCLQPIFNEQAAKDVAAMRR